MPATKETTHQLGIRMDADTVRRLDAAAAKLSMPGLPLTRTDALRMAVMEGLRKIEAEEKK